ncbi:hypothetical protein QVD17_24133 [Tagetes erecta]|uniref:Uncharacterized protein n=1 Tax=Tagetes erecta TaxID=13708 RepID=A0AAD8KHH2_TARER|nr:hypothetical protein QVD17_24133 [Tagetes erecta]
MGLGPPTSVTTMLRPEKAPQTRLDVIWSRFNRRTCNTSIFLAKRIGFCPRFSGVTNASDIVDIEATRVRPMPPVNAQGQSDKDQSVRKRRELEDGPGRLPPKPWVINVVVETPVGSELTKQGIN